MNLPKRLERIVELCPESKTACDIGCDHAYVAIELVKRGKASHVLACDVNAGPLEQAKKNISMQGLSEKITLRLGDGLGPVEKGEAETVICAGMGGPLILHILKGRCRDFRYFLLSPQSEPETLRHYLYEEGIRIQREEMLKEDGKYYVLILAENPFYKKEEEAGKEAPSEEGEKDYGKAEEAEFIYGPLLLKKRDPVLKEYLEKEKQRYQEILKKTEKEEVRRDCQHCLTALSYYE